MGGGHADRGQWTGDRGQRTADMQRCIFMILLYYLYNSDVVPLWKLVGAQSYRSGQNKAKSCVKIPEQACE